MTPFQALYGRPPPSISSYVTGTTTVAALDESLRHRHSILSMARYHLARAQLRMKQQADRHRRDLTFAVGYWVLLRLQPYRQLSVRGRKFRKLAPRFFGPFRVLRRLGPVAYELSLPSESRIHPVFHTSLLKPFHGDPAVVPIVDLHQLPDPVPALIPSAILGHRNIHTTDGVHRFSSTRPTNRKLTHHGSPPTSSSTISQILTLRARSLSEPRVLIQPKYQRGCTLGLEAKKGKQPNPPKACLLLG
ncbi:UNVERIFIED_CONTAM: hypothetical protein Sradi_6826700 [Sesamum radiatum]|uniref:Tf2-1-like SH3-like domain-containing protein n=1 Tax=Sesamum radiatum TaxID=300843 RepID=A0AAW2JW67_SESRA